ncbi:MAG: HD domain-containing phosphohydrolase [Acidobacteriota bacterium]
MPPATILVADDDQPSADLLRDLLAMDGHHVQCVSTRQRALEVCASNPPDLVVLDLMAQGQGFEVCRVLKDGEETRLVPVVIVTAQSERHERLRGIEAGADDFLSKPFDPLELRARIRSLVRLKRYTDELESAESVILGLGATIEARDPSTQGHCQRLARYATGFGRALSLSSRDLEALGRGGFLHDIGKIAVPDHVLLKSGALDPEETLVMREHPIVGDTLCAGLRSLRDVRPIVRHHHEHLDGSGYPDGLCRDAVPLLAQIVAIVDVFDALTTERPYRKALPQRMAFDVLEEESSKGWRDGALVREFIGLADTLL